ncbi:PTS transporter subunit EIIC [Tuanshanicoccus lijuaniae]|uniref:PTS transporter subunit EIIC n=1 Tax=Aerococcaceae bacterium zg-1292 TaxID=2774330 RepID=UPI0019382192|nr:PTS transporter subunit EIIC [Aerococcaceae bacterium zg-1292]QQA36852.1 PTS transporter subunit EIIC [Aerococcaceae bacterium zg-1292]
MKVKIMEAMQKFSRAMFIPVLILPIAGLLIAIGNILTNARLIEVLPFMDNPITKNFGSILTGSLVTILVNLGVIFCVGIAVGLANDKKGEAGFTALLSFLVFINAMNRTLTLNGQLIEADSLSGTGQTMVLGVQVLDMGVFAGIMLGLIVAYVFNKYNKVEFNNAFNIYGGTRFAFIVLIPVIVLFAILMTYIWPSFQFGINQLGGFIQKAGNFGLFLYGALERLLIPTGLHHLVYTPFLYSSLGGTETIAGQVFEGSRNIYFAEMVEPTIQRLSDSVIWDARGISKMFGLIGACLAMYMTASPDKKMRARAILIPAAFTSFIAGVTEPIEFSFMFVAPILFVIHAGLSGLSMVVLNLFNVRAIGPNGFIDFLLMNVPLGISKTSWPMYIVVGLIFFAIYFIVFKFMIEKFNLKTIGREAINEETRLYNKKDYLTKKNNRKTIKENNDSFVTDMGSIIVDALGGKENIVSVDNCYTRLRLIVKDSSLINEEILTNTTNANGVIINNENVHVVYGLNVNKMREAVDKFLMNH